jgi:RNA polymerase sigma-70 factor (TIGR02943 family)
MTSPRRSAGTDEVDPEQWLDLYGNHLYRYALSRVSDAETAQDLVQEALAAGIQSYRRFKGQSSIKTWLIAILKRKVVDHYRRLRVRRETEGAALTSESVEHQFNHRGNWHVMPDEWAVNPGSVYEQKEFMDILYHCLAGMPQRLAEIFMLREFEELNTKAICEQLDISESNCWVMLYRARMQLRACIEKKWLDEARKE